MSSLERLGHLIICVGLLTACTLPADRTLLKATSFASESPTPSADISQCPRDGGAVELNDADSNLDLVDDLNRTITLGRTVTVIVFTLGIGDKEVAVGRFSSFHSHESELPPIGYQRRFSAGSVLALDPLQVMATDEAGPSEGHWC